MPDRNVRDDGVHQVGRHFVHPFPAAGRAKPALPTRESDKPFVLTRLTPQADKAVGENPATEVGIDFLMDVAREGSPFVPLGSSQEALKVLLDRPVKNGAFRLMPKIGSRSSERSGGHPLPTCNTFDQSPGLGIKPGGLRNGLQDPDFNCSRERIPKRDYTPLKPF